MERTVSCSVLIEAPVQVVFDYLADVRRHHEWNRALDRTELLDGGPIGQGTRAAEVRRLLGREMRSPFVITRHEPPDRQDFHTTGGPVRPDGVMTCIAEGTGTRLSYRLTLRGLMASILALTIKRGMPENWANAKQILESSYRG